ncbi:hypothetical protein KY362_03055 [Candidatus Woesearchaeota archaeon]|nr:hypothetical protein [Candidatus Woesearchaeota archaeon]
MNYSTGNDLVFVVLALASALALLSKQGIAAAVFFVLALAYIIFEHQINDYLKSA